MLLQVVHLTMAVFVSTVIKRSLIREPNLPWDCLNYCMFRKRRGCQCGYISSESCNLTIAEGLNVLVQQQSGSPL